LKRIPSEETKAKLSEANKGEITQCMVELVKIIHFLVKPIQLNLKQECPKNNLIYGKLVKKSPVSKIVLVCSSSTSTILSHEFASYSKATNHFYYSAMCINKYLKSSKLFLKQWILSMSEK
jgi:hypothetical protein